MTVVLAIACGTLGIAIALAIIAGACSSFYDRGVAAGYVYALHELHESQPIDQALSDLGPIRDSHPTTSTGRRPS